MIRDYDTAPRDNLDHWICDLRLPRRRLRRSRHSVRSAIHKPQIDRLVVRWVTTSESLLLYACLRHLSTTGRICYNADLKLFLLPCCLANSMSVDLRLRKRVVFFGLLSFCMCREKNRSLGEKIGLSNPLATIEARWLSSTRINSPKEILGVKLSSLSLPLLGCVIHRAVRFIRGKLSVPALFSSGQALLVPQSNAVWLCPSLMLVYTPC